jgi:hypothetical protein
LHVDGEAEELDADAEAAELHVGRGDGRVRGEEAEGCGESRRKGAGREGGRVRWHSEVRSGTSGASFRTSGHSVFFRSFRESAVEVMERRVIEYAEA